MEPQPESAAMDWRKSLALARDQLECMRAALSWQAEMVAASREQIGRSRVLLNRQMPVWGDGFREPPQIS